MEWSFLTSFLLPFTLNFSEDGEEKEATKCTGWRSQSGEDARIRESITEEGDWGGNRVRAKRRCPETSELKNLGCHRRWWENLGGEECHRETWWDAGV